MHGYDLVEENAYKLGYSEGYEECRTQVKELVERIYEAYAEERYTYENTMRMLDDLKLGLQEL